MAGGGDIVGGRSGAVSRVRRTNRGHGDVVGIRILVSCFHHFVFNFFFPDLIAMNDCD